MRASGIWRTMLGLCICLLSLVESIEPFGNECDPSKGCNVCPQCCKDYIPDGAQCNICVELECAQKNVCSPATACTVCPACCSNLRPNGVICDFCVTKECPAAASCHGNSTKIPASECVAWKEAYDSLGGSNWNQCADHRDDPCGCTGVTCTNGSSITAISLVSNQLAGSIPANIFEFAELSQLDLSVNELTGTVPPGLSKISSLTYLNLGVNLLTGILPGRLTELPHLEHIDLRCNNLTGAVPNLPWSQYTAKDACHIGGPSDFYGCSKLTPSRKAPYNSNQWKCPLPADIPSQCHATCK